MYSVIQENSLFQFALFPPFRLREALLRKRVIEHVPFCSVTHVEHPRVERGRDGLHHAARGGTASGERGGGGRSSGQCVCGGNDVAANGQSAAHRVLPAASGG